jgi:hypothetical protein
VERVKPTAATRQSGGGAFIFFMLMAVMAAGAWMILSNHAVTRGTGELWSAERIFTTIDDYTKDPSRGPCKKLYVAECPLATVRDPKSPRFGLASPQVRVFCQLNDGGWGVMASWGLYYRIGINAYPDRVDRFLRICELDRCAWQDLTWLQRFLSGW